MIFKRKWKKDIVNAFEDSVRKAEDLEKFSNKKPTNFISSTDFPNIGKKRENVLEFLTNNIKINNGDKSLLVLLEF